MVFNLYGMAENGFNEPVAPDAALPEDNSSFIATMKGLARQSGGADVARMGLDLPEAPAPTNWSRVFNAAEAQQRLVSSTNAKSIADAQVFSDIIGKVREATGVTLEHPSYMPFSNNPDSRARKREALDQIGGSASERMVENRAAFFERARQLQEQYPDKLAGLSLDAPDALAGKLAFEAEGEMKAAMGAEEKTAPAMLAAFAGAAWGARKDPLFWASLPFGAGGTGATIGARVLSAAVSNATANAGFAAAASPFVQAWRAEAGLEAGFGEAAKDIGFAGAAGLVLGGGMRGIGEAATRIKAGRGTPADFDAAEKGGVFIPEETRDALRSAGAREAFDAEIADGALPPGIEPERARMVLAEASARAEDPSAPLPLVDPPAAPGLTDKLALEIVEAARTPMEAVDALRAGNAKPILDPEFRRIGEQSVVLFHGTKFSDPSFNPADSSYSAQAVWFAADVNAAARHMGGRGGVYAINLDPGRYWDFRKAADVEALLADLPEAETAALADGLRAGNFAAVESDAAQAALKRLDFKGFIFDDFGGEGRNLSIGVFEKQANPRKLSEADVAALSSDQGLVQSALASDIPALRDAGRLASLPDEALALVRSGEVAPSHAAIVAATTPDPGQQTALVAVLKEAAPESVGAARVVVSEKIEADSAIATAQARMGAYEAVRDYQPDAIIAPVRPDGPVGVFQFDAGRLETDARRFQYKDNGDAQGVTIALKSVTRWDPAKANQAIIWEQADGRLFVVDGHQRSGLARRLLEQGLEDNIKLPGILYRENDGVTPEYIRAVAAAKNIAEGSGSPIDGAKVLRSRPDLMDGSMPISRTEARQSFDLARLDDESFRMVVNEVVPYQQAAIVGRLIPNDGARQQAAMKALARFEPRNETEASVLVQRVSAAEIVKAEGEQTSLFGDMMGAESTAGEEMRIVARAIGELKKDKTLLSRVVANADRIEAAGSTIARDAASAVVADADLFAKLITSNAYSAGAIRDILVVLAREVQNGGRTINDAVEGLLSSVRGSLESGMGGRAEAGASRFDFEPGAEGKPQTLIPGVEPVTDKARLDLEASRPLTGGDAAPPDGGLFDMNARLQDDMFAAPDSPSPAPRNMRDMIPVTRDDGSVAMVAREALASVSERERRLAFVTETCTL